MASAARSSANALDVDAWLLLEKKTTFYATKWRTARASFSRTRLFPPPARQQAVLTLAFDDADAAPAELVVVRAHASAARREAVTDGRVCLPLEVRSMADVRTAQRFLTSVPSQMLDLFLDAADADRVLAFLAGNSTTTRVSSGAASSTAPSLSASELIDGAFAALERAQQERERGRKERALTLFREAERGFSATERLLPDERSRGLIASRRRDLERSIAALEKQILREEAAAGAQVTERPPPPPPPVDILARLEELRRFVATPDTSADATESTGKSPDVTATTPGVVAAAPAPVGSELATRLAALRNGGKAPTSGGVDKLAERLRRLRGDNSEQAVGAAAWAKEGEASDEEEQVKRVIQQATEELALGIVDDLDAEDDEDLSITSSGVDSSSSDSRSDRSEEGGRKH